MSCASRPTSLRFTAAPFAAPMAARFFASGQSNRHVTNASWRRCPTKPRTSRFHPQSMPAEIAYSDRPVAVEPGLSLDVLPIANLLAKLALLELLPTSHRP